MQRNNDPGPRLWDLQQQPLSYGAPNNRSDRVAFCRVALLAKPLPHKLLRFCFVLIPSSCDLLFIYPPTFSSSVVHFIVDDFRARKPTDAGGSDYLGLCTTVEGVCNMCSS